MKRELVLAALLASVAPPAWAHSDAKATEAIGQFLAAYQKTSTFVCKLDVLTKLGKDESNMTVRCTYAHPRNVALTVLEAPQFPACNGTTLTWLGDKRARVSTKFYGLPLAVTVPVNDPRICNLRGYSMTDVDLGTEVQLLTSPDAHLHYLGETRMLGHMCDGIEVKSPRLLKGIEREVIWLDTKTHFPALREMFEAGQVVYRVAFSDYAFNPRLPASLFAKF